MPRKTTVNGQLVTYKKEFYEPEYSRTHLDLAPESGQFFAGANRVYFRLFASQEKKLETPLPTARLHLLFAGPIGLQDGGVAPVAAADLPDEAVVCTCNQVRAGAVRACAAEGCRTVADVACETRATTGCGSCRGAVEQLLASVPDPAPVPVLVPERRTA